MQKHELGMCVDCENPMALRRALLEACAQDLSSRYASAQADFAEKHSKARFAAALDAAFAATASTAAYQENTAREVA